MQQKPEKEKLLEIYPLPITINGTKTILEQMEKYICRIENQNGNGTGFFCKIPCGNEEIKVMITNNHVINEEILKNTKKIKVTLNDNKIKKSIVLKDKKILFTGEFINRKKCGKGREWRYGLCRTSKKEIIDGRRRKDHYTCDRRGGC